MSDQWSFFQFFKWIYQERYYVGHSLYERMSDYFRFICLFIGVGVILCHFLFWLYYSSDQEWVLPNMLSYIGDLIGLSGAGMCSFHILRP
ncbi:callose synthase 10-like isoform X4 [Magnolia sinica]|uniref:callose synthase 10-like isoform X4 n=1 Tax=Magnolia sinica TaxID=86752 RepID=UPI0026593592|nr:callose synthase 10-like isoform X4 [Magnolia sinica]